MSVFHQLMNKWFGLSDVPCDTCEILREQLHKSDVERKELLLRLLDKDKPEPPQIEKEDLTPITPQFIPWRVRQQMLEAEDRKQAQILRNRQKEIADLELELGIHKDSVGAGMKQDASYIRETVSVHADAGTQSQEGIGTE